MSSHYAQALLGLTTIDVLKLHKINRTPSIELIMHKHIQKLYYLESSLF